VTHSLLAGCDPVKEIAHFAPLRLQRLIFKPIGKKE
jgi:hypothetical protein